MAADRTAIVTGASKRVGAEIARALLDDGWTVVAHVHHETDDVPDGASQGCCRPCGAGLRGHYLRCGLRTARRSAC